MPTWTPWRPFPDPRTGGILHAPIGPGVYDLRRISTREPVLFGIGARCAHRMTSLLPAPFGCGTRNNQNKRKYLLATSTTSSTAPSPAKPAPKPPTSSAGSKPTTRTIASKRDLLIGPMVM